MPYREKIPLWNHRQPAPEQAMPQLTPYLVGDGAEHPALLLIPGGGYSRPFAENEGFPVAEILSARYKFHTFVLEYRTKPLAFPAALEDGLRAMKLIRGNAGAWQVIPDRIASCGFSAGAHLAGALGVIPELADGCDGDEFDPVDPRPDGMILGYGVLSFEPWSHAQSVRNFCGGDRPERFSLEKHVGSETPPAFVWHTIADQLVSCRNSLAFVEAMMQHRRPCELHLFPDGDHGMLLGRDTPVGVWPELAGRFLENQWDRRRRTDKDERYTYDYQCRKNVSPSGN